MARRATRRFFATDAESLARGLLGATLVRTLDSGEVLRGMIVETEAYVGVRDRASHAFGGRRTPRNESMYSRPGTLYVYFTYGMHHCANIVCGTPGEPVAVLLRALEPVDGIELMRSNRGSASTRGPISDRMLCRGPGNLCRALAIDRSLDGVDLAGGAGAAVSVEISRRSPIEPARIVRGPRIGLGDAGVWSDKPLRFWVRGSPFVSGRTSPKTNGPRSV
jgi:DNA-3-methyladenine glycosylase